MVSEGDRRAGNLRVENVKKKRIKSYVWVGIVVGLLMMAAAIWLVWFYGRVYDSNTSASVDGRIEADDQAVENAVKTRYACGFSDLIGAQKGTQPVQISLLFEGMTEEPDTNEAILKMLEDSHIKASFALSAAEGLADEEFVSHLLESGAELVSNGLTGETNLQTRQPEEMIKTMLKSRERLSAMADVSLSLLYCSSTSVNAELLRAVSASGYEALVVSEPGEVLDETSFHSKEQLETYLDGLSGTVILVVNLRGTKEEIQKEPPILVQKPAVDKQPDANTAQKEKEEPVPIQTQVEWLVQGIQSRKLETEYVSRLPRKQGEDVLRQFAEKPDGALSMVYHHALTDQTFTALGIRGIPEGEALEKALETLKSLSVKATFFVSEEERNQRQGEIRRIMEAGCSVGIDGVSMQEEPDTRMEWMERLTEDFFELEKCGAVSSRWYLVNGECEYKNLRAVAGLLQINLISKETPGHPSAGSWYVMETFDEAQIAAWKSEAERSGLKLTDIPEVMERSGVLTTLSEQELRSMRTGNAGKLEELQSMVYTTERAVSFVFYGIRDEAPILDAMAQLKRRGASGTFCATLNELMSEQKILEQVISQGYELAISYRASDVYPQTFDAVAAYIDSWNRYAKWRYGVETKLVFMPFHTPEKETEEAVSASGCRLMGSTFRIVKDGDEKMKCEEVPAALEKLHSMRLMRGAFVCFHTAFYENDRQAVPGETVLGAMLEQFMESHLDSLAYRLHETGKIEDGSRFSLLCASELLNSSEKYEFASGKQTDITIDKNVLTNMETEQERFDFIAERYLGTRFIDSPSKLPGFTSRQIRRMDKTGVFTGDRVLFLSFDDWGTEQSINELLYVLQKHEVKATFFIKTGYVDANPNLLRAIAVQGHQIASHTDGHLPLSDTSKSRADVEVSLTEEEAENLRKDLVTSYDKLYRYTGNVVVDGRPALSKMFRPPTLAVSRIGVDQVFDVGYEYSISGEISTGDYEASSYEDMVERLNRRAIGGGKYLTVHNGSMIVMHIQENAKYTAQALDTMIPIWKEQGYGFARMDDYLGSGS